MELTKEEWEKVQSWLEGYRVACNKEARKAQHEKIQNFYHDINIEVRDFLHSKIEIKAELNVSFGRVGMNI